MIFCISPGETEEDDKKFVIPVIPTPNTCAYTLLVPQRIHRQACWRCGAGSGHEDKTQSLMT